MTISKQMTATYIVIPRLQEAYFKGKQKCW